MSPFTESVAMTMPCPHLQAHTLPSLGLEGTLLVPICSLFRAWMGPNKRGQGLPLGAPPRKPS